MLSIKDLLAKMLVSLKGCEGRTLLWSNSDPTASFANQTISLDLSDYDICEVFFFESSNVGRRYSMSTRIPKGSTGIMRNLSTPASGSVCSVIQRSVQVATNGVDFGTGQYRGVTATSAMSTANDVFVPLSIYGIKLGGYCLTSIASRLSAIGRWWEHVRCEGFVGENAGRDSKRKTCQASSYCFADRIINGSWLNFTSNHRYIFVWIHRRIGSVAIIRRLANYRSDKIYADLCDIDGLELLKRLTQWYSEGGHYRIGIATKRGCFPC